MAGMLLDNRMPGRNESPADRSRSASGPAAPPALVSAAAVPAPRGSRRWLGGGRFDLVLFSQELLALLEAGLSLVEAIETLAAKEQGTERRNVLLHLRERLFEGQPLSSALQRFPALFPMLYVSAIRASEKTGAIPETLRRFIVYQQQVELVRNKLITASIYPALLLAVGMLVVVFLMAYVVPRFSAIYADIGGNLPLLSRWLLEWGRLLEAHGAAVLLAGAALAAAAGYLLRLSPVRAAVLARVRRLPGIGERMKVYQFARFYRTLGMLLRGGTPLVTALDMVGGLLQPALRAHLQAAAANVREGNSISRAFEAHGLTTPVSLRLLRVAERTGGMSDMMERIAAFYEEDIARWVEWFTRLFEPLLMAFIGLIIGLVVVLMYLPIFELAGGIQK